MAVVQVVSPRFRGPLAGALASHPMLQLKNWDPWRPVKELAAHLRTFLEVRPRFQGPVQHVAEASSQAALPRSMQPHRDILVLKSHTKFITTSPVDLLNLVQLTVTPDMLSDCSVPAACHACSWWAAWMCRPRWRPSRRARSRRTARWRRAWCAWRRSPPCGRPAAPSTPTCTGARPD